MANRRSDDWIGEDVDTRRIQPYEAIKTYLCPGCNQEIPPGLGHLVVVPRDAPDLRRHWHHSCWENRARRRPRDTRPSRSNSRRRARRSR